MTLLVLAAGIGSRYGGIKQIDGFGPNGETIMDYSLFDAIRESRSTVEGSLQCRSSSTSTSGVWAQSASRNALISRSMRSRVAPSSSRPSF